MQQNRETLERLEDCQRGRLMLEWIRWDSMLVAGATGGAVGILIHLLLSVRPVNQRVHTGVVILTSMVAGQVGTSWWEGRAAGVPPADSIVEVAGRAPEFFESAVWRDVAAEAPTESRQALINALVREGVAMLPLSSMVDLARARLELADNSVVLCASYWGVGDQERIGQHQAEVRSSASPETLQLLEVQSVAALWAGARRRLSKTPREPEDLERLQTALDAVFGAAEAQGRGAVAQDIAVSANNLDEARACAIAKTLYGGALALPPGLQEPFLRSLLSPDGAVFVGRVVPQPTAF